MNRLILFDIDGTILTSNGAAGRAFRQALREVYGAEIPTSGYSFAGRTDPQIARDLLTRAGIEPNEISARFTELWTRYTGLLADEFERVTASVYPGVRELLARLEAAHSESVLGLLTGNVRDGAQLKLTSARLDIDRFLIGAFGSDHHERRELPAIAIERAERATGHRFEGKSVVIIGDTPMDIACGEHLGVRTIAVATGTYDAASLAACHPDYLFEDLSDHQAVWDAIFS